MKKYTTKTHIDKCREIHGDKYDYSLAKFGNRKNKIDIICNKHGIFRQRASDHLCVRGCPDYYQDRNDSYNDSFIERASKIHNNKYIYIEEYKKAHDYIKIKCHVHGVFKQKAYDYLNGQGCSRCQSSNGERKIENILIENNIQYIKNYKFGECKNKKKSNFNFFLVKLNTCIEYDGIQHFESLKFFGGKEKFNYRRKNDQIKNLFCKKNSINLVRISYLNDIISKLNKIIK